MMQESLRHLCVRFSLLVDEPTLLLQALSRLDERAELPRLEKLCRVHVDSLLLRLIREEAFALTSDLRDPMAPWHAFRIRFNQESLRLRTYFLSFLPMAEGAPFVDRKPRTSRPFFQKLWHHLTDGIPTACLPRDWREHCAEFGSRPFSNKGTQVYSEQSFSDLLLKAASIIEIRRPARLPLVLPAQLQAPSKAVVADEVNRAFKDFGGLTQSSGTLRDALDGILSWKEAEPYSDYSPDSLELFELSRNLWPASFHASTLLASAFIRRGVFQEAEQVLGRTLSLCSDAQQISVVLSNLASLSALQQDFPMALHHIQEAIAYCPESSMAQQNHQAILRAIRTGILEEIQDHA